MGLKPWDDGVKQLLGGNYFGDKGMSGGWFHRRGVCGGKRGMRTWVDPKFHSMSVMKIFSIVMIVGKKIKLHCVRENRALSVPLLTP